MNGSSGQPRAGSDDPWVQSVADLVAAVPDGCRLSVGGFHLTRIPVTALLALTDRGIRDLTYVAWGGGLALDLLIAGGAVSKAEICFSAFDVFGSARLFREAAESGNLEVHDLTALTLMSGLRAEAEHLGWEVMQQPAGSTFAADLEPVDSPSVPMVRVDPVPVDVLLLHAQRADDQGNVEIAGARGTDLSTLFAARRVLVTVEERVAVGRLGAPRAFIVPRSHVHGVALAPKGASPTSCLPYYPTDFHSLSRYVESPDTTAGRRELVSGSPARYPGAPALVRELTARTDPPAVDVETDEPSDQRPWTIAELLAVLIARTVDDGSVCSFGSSAPLPAVAYLLAKHTHAPHALLMSFNGGYVDVAARPMSLTFGEAMDFDSAPLHTGGDETYRWYYQPGRVTHEVVGAAQVDARGATNNLWLDRPDGGRVRLPGQGGMADVANLHRDFTIYLPRHSPRNTVSQLGGISAARAWADPDTRRRYGLVPGSVRVLTNLCVLEPDPASGLLQVTGVHPGVSPTDVVDATGFPVTFASDCGVTRAPTAHELRALRTYVDPLQVRNLDFVPARQRRDLITRILEQEERAASMSSGDGTITTGRKGVANR